MEGDKSPVYRPDPWSPAEGDKSPVYRPDPWSPAEPRGGDKSPVYRPDPWSPKDSPLAPVVSDDDSPLYFVDEPPAAFGQNEDNNLSFSDVEDPSDSDQGVPQPPSPVFVMQSPTYIVGTAESAQSMTLLCDSFKTSCLQHNSPGAPPR